MLFKYHVVITDKLVHIIYKSMQLRGKNYALTARREAKDIYSRTMIREAILIRSCWDFLLFFA